MRASHVSGARQSASRYTRTSPVASRRPPCFPRDDQAFTRLVHHAHVRNLLRHGARLIGARIVDYQDFVRDSGLGEK